MGTRVYVANQGDHNVSVIDAATNAVVAVVTVGRYPSGVAVTPDGMRVYVSNCYNDNVSVIDTATNDVVATVMVGPGHPSGPEACPVGVAVNPAGTLVYVTLNSTNRPGFLSVIDTATNIVVARVAVGNGPFGVAVSPDGARVYVANHDSNHSDGITPGGDISVVDAATNTVVATVVAPIDTNPVIRDYLAQLERGDGGRGDEWMRWARQVADELDPTVKARG